LLNESIEGRSGLVSAADCVTCPLHQAVHSTSPLGARGFTGRCMMGRAESGVLMSARRLLDEVPCMDKELVAQRRAEAAQMAEDLEDML
jgi:hypothetical protein